MNFMVLKVATSIYTLTNSVEKGLRESSCKFVACGIACVCFRQDYNLGKFAHEGNFFAWHLKQTKKKHS